jgi:hypothetical protein
MRSAKPSRPEIATLNVEQIRNWLNLLGETHSESGHEWVRTHCPLAPWAHDRGTDENPSFGIKIVPGDSPVHCFSCNFSGTQTTLLIVLAGYVRDTNHALDIRGAMRAISDVEDGGETLELQPWEERAQISAPDFIFSEEWLATYRRAYTDTELHPYLIERKMPHRVAEVLDIRLMSKEGRVCFPIRNWGGDLVGLHGRTTIGGLPTYRMIKCQGNKNPMAWLGESWVDPNEPVVLVESVFDLARVFEIYRNVMCPLTASMSNRKINRISRLNHVVVMFDADRAGDQAWRKVATALRDDCVVEKVSLPSGKDPSDLSSMFVGKLLREIVDLEAPTT